MKLARELERRLEGLVDGLAARVFVGPLHPAELAARLVREADLACVDGPLGPATVNRFRLRINPADLGESVAPPELAAELAGVVETVAAEQGWRLEGPARVEIEADPTASRGSPACSADVVEGEPAAWAHLRGATTLTVRHNRALLGRSPDADLVVTDDLASRRHALLWRENGRVHVRDLGSSNGTSIDGAPLAGDPVELGVGSVLVVGGSSFRFDLG